MGSEAKNAPMLASLERACEWLALRGVDRQPLDLLEDAAEGRIQVFAAVPERAWYLWCEKQGSPVPGMSSAFSIRQRAFEKGEMLHVEPIDCLQFLQTGNANIYGEGMAEVLKVSGHEPLFHDMASVLTVLHIDAFRVRGCDLEAFADAQAITPATGASAPAVARPEQCGAWREAEILEAIRRLGFDPLALPAVQNGKANPQKAAVCAALTWPKTTFDHAWKRLTGSKRIRYR